MMLISVGLLGAFVQTNAGIKHKNKQMEYFAMAAKFGILFSYICFFLTVWRKSSSFTDLVNCFEFTLSKNPVGERDKDVR